MRRLILPVLVLVLALCACSPKHLVIGAAADALAGEGSGWGTDDDPELVASAVPFALKTIDSLIAQEPDNPKLLVAGCSAYTQYGYAFVDQPAQMSSDLKPAQVEFAHKRAMNLLARAYGYCVHGLDMRHEGFSSLIEKDPAAALKPMEKEDVPLLYWTAASLALRIAGQKDNPELLSSLPRVGELGSRALELDEAWDHGSLHELMEAYEASRPAAAGGSEQKAAVHRDAALKESENKKLGPHVTWAEDILVAKQDKDGFMKLLDQVLAYDVNQPEARDFRLANVLAQRRALWLKNRVDDLFVDARSPGFLPVAMSEPRP
ncbi:MAG: hypothetical protein JST54_19165 [Deltaproteobacteria bacterium]|nr:hypothetical protein [Deltaproteobacteria bacterium]